MYIYVLLKKLLVGFGYWGLLGLLVIGLVIRIFRPDFRILQIKALCVCFLSLTYTKLKKFRKRLFTFFYLSIRGIL